MQPTNEPNVLLVRAIRYVPNFDVALDFGAGKCRDSRFLLNLGFKKVIAFDRTRPDYIPSNEGFMFEKQNMETLTLEVKADLINAQMVLPFIKNIPGLISEVHRALNKDGVFVGQFFAPEEMSAKSPSVTSHTLEEVKELLKDFRPITITEESRFPIDPVGHYKVWHTIDFIVCK